MSGMVRLGLQDCQKHRHLPLPPWAVPASAWLGGHNRPQPFKCKLDGGKRRKRGNELDLSIGGVQLEKMSISY